MKASRTTAGPALRLPILLFDGQCTPCCRLAAWVQASASRGGLPARIVVRPIGEDPKALLALNPGLGIWAAYATIHLVMADGSMKIGGEAIAEVLRRLPNCAWFSWLFACRILGMRPFQALLNAAFAVLSYARPILGCESCGTPSVWLRPFVWLMRQTGAIGKSTHPHPASPALKHFSARAGAMPAAPGARH